MTPWNWECFKDYAQADLFKVSNAGPLLSPILEFMIKRDESQTLILESVVVGGSPEIISSQYQRGDVRLADEKVDFTGPHGMKMTAHGVVPQRKNWTYNPSFQLKTVQLAQIDSLDAVIQPAVTPAYAIDWVGNFKKGMHIWPGALIRDTKETTVTRIIEVEGAAITLSDPKAEYENSNYFAIEITIDGTRLFLQRLENATELPDHPGWIFYVGSPTDEFRKKVREVLAFCLGNYFTYYGTTRLSGASEVVSFIAVSPPNIGRINEIPSIPPSVLQSGATNVGDCKILENMANAIYNRYNDVSFGSFSWAYWHAVCAPVHMAAAHFGAAIESLQKHYISERPNVFNRVLLKNGEWIGVRDVILSILSEAKLEPETEAIMRNKIISNLNQIPQSVLSEKMLGHLGLTLGSLEATAWKHRNIAAHGAVVNQTNIIPTIMKTKLLKIILHRMILKITGASEFYYDDYSMNHAVRPLNEPIPTQ